MRKMEYSVCHERETKKKSESPTGIEPMTWGFLKNKQYGPHPTNLKSGKRYVDDTLIAVLLTAS